MPLLRRGFDFLIGLFFQYGTYYLYESKLKEMDNADFMPGVNDFTFKIVTSNREADQLVANGFEFQSSGGIYSYRERLNKGTIAFCLFIGRELAHVTWVAMTAEAKNSFTPLPYRVDFLNKEVCSVASQTIPKYRQKGLAAYVYYKELQFLRERGIMTVRYAIKASNIAAQRAPRLGKIYAKARYLKILWWKLWSEKRYLSNLSPLSPSPSKGKGR